MKKTLRTMVAILVMAISMGTFMTAKFSTAEEIARDGRFIAYGNGTVLDTKTNLMWAAKDNGSDINWANAKSYCENYRGGGYTDWRMPTQDELAGLYDRSKRYYLKQEGFYIHLTEMIQLSDVWPWASETRGNEAACFCFRNGARHWELQSSAAGFHFLLRAKGSGVQGSGNLRALPVRSAK